MTLIEVGNSTSLRSCGLRNRFKDLELSVEMLVER